MEFKEILTSLRTRKVLSKTDLAKAVGITRQQIIRFEKGEATPNMADLRALADYFAVSADFLLGRDCGNSICIPGKLSEADHKLLEQFIDILVERNRNV